MSFAVPGWLGFLALVPLLAALFAVAGWWSRRALRKVFSAELWARVVPIGVRRRRVIRDLAMIAGTALAIVALAEPRFDKAVRTLNVRGTDIVVLLDLSRSMDARDVDPSRLERARREIADLGRQIAGDRVGLVMFAGGAYPRLPLTADFKAVELVVSEASTDAFDSQGSDLGAAIRTALDLLDRSRQDAGQALLVLSDGETHDPDDALAAAKTAADRGVPIFAMGIGIEPSPIPMPDGRFFQFKGERVLTSPDFEILKQAAKLTGGAFVTSNAASRDMEQLYGELRRSVEATERSTQRRETWRSAFQVPLGLSVALLLTGAWIGDGRRRFGAAAAVMLAIGLTAGAPARAADGRAEADELYRQGKYPQAIERYVELSLERPDDPDVFDRLAAARYRAGDYEGAARAYDAASELRGDDPDTEYNSGNAYYRAGRLEDAERRYDQVLAADPDHEGAKENQALVKEEITARRAAKPKPPPSGGDQDQPQDAPPQSGDESAPQQPQPGQGDQASDPKPGQGKSDPSEGEPGQPQPGDPQDGQQQGAPSDAPPDQPGSSDAVSPTGVDPTDP
ncbi:MAG: VWA domain-containing protein, partial [Myxococcota bacterium]